MSVFFVFTKASLFLLGLVIMCLLLVIMCLVYFLFVVV